MEKFKSSYTEDYKTFISLCAAGFVVQIIFLSSINVVVWYVRRIIKKNVVHLELLESRYYWKIRRFNI